MTENAIHRETWYAKSRATAPPKEIWVLTETRPSRHLCLCHAASYSIKSRASNSSHLCTILIQTCYQHRTQGTAAHQTGTHNLNRIKQRPLSEAPNHSSRNVSRTSRGLRVTLISIISDVIHIDFLPTRHREMVPKPTKDPGKGVERRIPNHPRQPARKPQFLRLATKF